MKMEGLYYYHDSDELFFIMFYEDGQAIFFGKNTRYGQQFTTSNGVRIDTDKTDYLFGRYHISEGTKIRIRVEGEYKMDFHGTIKDNNTIELICHCRITNHRKMVFFKRFSEREHLGYTHLQKRL